MSLVNTYTFEEGTDGASVPSGSNGVVAIGGTVTYDAASAVHGSLGVKMAASASGLVYSLPTSGNNSWSDSFYMSIATSSTSTCIFANIRNASTQLVKLAVSPSTGKFIIMNTSSVTQATSTVSWPTGQVIRCDVHYSYDGANATVSCSFFIGSNSEGTTPDDTISATFAVSAVPTRFALGTISVNWQLGYDTYRQYSSSTDTIAPYQPGGGGGISSSPLQVYDGSSMVDASAFVYVSGGGSGATQALNVDFEDGTTSPFTVVHGATVGTSYAYSGTYGCRLTPDPSTSYATLTYKGTPAGYTWARFKANFRIVTITNPSNTYTNVFEIGNNLTVSPKNQFTVYVDGANLMMDFRTTTDATLLDDNVSVGTWHSIDVSVNFGTTSYTAYVTYDGVLQPTFVSQVACTATTVGQLWVGYPSTATDQTTDWDNIQLWVGNSDPAQSGTSLVAVDLTVN